MNGFRFLTAMLTCVVGALLVGRAAPEHMWAAPLAIASPTATPVATPRALDLAAMTLAPAELGLPGTGLATYDGSSRMVYAEQAFGNGSDSDASDAGWRGSYESALATVQAADPSLYLDSVVMRIHEFGDETSAAQDFNGSMKGLVADGVQVDRGTTRFGDRSAVARWSDVAAVTGKPYQEAMIAFQVDALTAEVIVYDFTNRAPDLAFLERLAVALLAKIDAELARDDVGLGTQVFRLAGESVTTVVDRYERRDGEVLPIAGESADWLAWRRDAYPAATDEYLVSLSIDGGVSNYVGRLIAFPDIETAFDAMHNAPARSAVRFGEGAEVLPLLGAETFGDESLTLTYATTTADGRTLRGFLVVARVGTIVAEVFVEAEQARPPLSTVQELVRSQVACIQDSACLEPASVPSELGRPVSTPTR